MNPMSRWTTWVGMLLAVTAGFAVKGATPAPPTPAAREIKAPTPSADATLCRLRLAGALRAPDKSENVALEYRFALDAGGDTKSDIGASKSLIVMIPDPIDSGMRRYYDQTLASVRLALAQAGWLEEGSWLPWQDLLVHKASIDAVAMCRRDVPGVIMFHRNEQQLAVLLVGESPTSGIHQNAFRQAVEYAEPQPLQIVGPFFSGNAHSLKEALDGKDAGFFFGAANGAGALGELTDAGYYSSIPEEKLECAAWHYLSDQQKIKTFDAGAGSPVTLHRVGILVESGTAFGETDQSGPCDLEPEVKLKFPIHVAALRAAYAATDSALKAGGGIARPTYLSMEMSETPSPDQPGDLSPATATSRDLALSHLLSEVAHEGLRYLAIRATDTADTVFLARRVRDVAPNVRLVFFNSDALFTHPELRHDLDGSLIVSTYPFLGSDDFAGEDPDDGHIAGHRDPRRHTHLPFETDLAEAEFNALVEALEPNKHSIEKKWPFPDGGVAEDVTWISALSMSEVIPLRVTLADHAPNELPELRLDPNVTPPNIWQILLTVLIIFAVVDALQLRRRRTVLEENEDPSPFRQDAVALIQLQYVHASVVRSFIALLMLMYFTIVDFFALKLHGSKSGIETIVTPILNFISNLNSKSGASRAALVLLATGAAYAIVITIYSRARRYVALFSGLAKKFCEKTIIRRTLITESLRLIWEFLIAMLLICFARMPWQTAEPLDNLFVLRTLAFANGVSIAWPMMCFWGVLWLFGHSRTEMLWLRLVTVLRTPAAGKTTLPATPVSQILGDTALEACEKQAVISLNGEFSLRHLFVFLGAGLLPFVIFVLRKPTGLESTEVIDLGVYVLIVCVLTIGGMAGHLYSAWEKQRTFLERLRLHPIYEWFTAVDTSVNDTTLFQPPGIRSGGVELERLVGLAKCTPGGMLQKLQLDDAIKNARADRDRSRDSSRKIEGEELGQLITTIATDSYSRGETQPATPEERALVATTLAMFIRRHLRQLGVLMMGIVGQSLLLLLAIEGYAFQPRRLLLTCAWVMILAVASMAIWLVVETNRNAVLSRISGTTPGKFQWNLDSVNQIARWVALPLLAMIAAQYPRATGSLAALVEPVLRALR